MHERPTLPFELLEEPAELARYQGWSRTVYEDLLAVQEGRLSHQAFDAKHLHETAILVLDLTGFTLAAARGLPARSAQDGCHLHSDLRG
jgi:hypothetical protein